jgi:4-hydroxy-tetrahydrodipicolinate reductase
MGREVCRAVLAAEDLELVAALDPFYAGQSVGDLTGHPEITLGIHAQLDQLIAADVEVMVDFTTAATAVEDVLFALRNGIHAVVGTTGVSEEMLASISKASETSPANIVIAPNFAFGAVLMMSFARQAARFFPDCEIIELHHDRKLDAPSGTALRTAKLIREVLDAPGPGNPEPASRGLADGKLRIHSVRLPGLVAHQEVIFGALGQTLTIRHDSIDRTSFMPGVLYAIRQVGSRRGMTVGLEEWLEG